MKLNQNEAQEIIRNAYGTNAYAIGCNEADGITTTIFWLYAGEDEDEYKAHEVKA